MNLDEAVNHAAEHVKQGWRIEMVIENGYAGIELFDSDGNIVDWEPCPDDFLPEQIVAACRRSNDL